MGDQPREIHLRMPWGVLALKSWHSSSLHPVLMIHGSEDNAASFDQLVPLLSNKYHYVSVDLPGHGYSTPMTPGLPLVFMQFVAILQRVVRHFDWPSFSILGHSFGAHLGFVLAASEMYRATVKRLILIDGTARSHICDESYLTRCTSEIEEILDKETRQRTEPQLSNEEALKKFTNRLFPISENAAKAMLLRTLVATNKGYCSNDDTRNCYTLMPHMSKHVHYFNASITVCPVLMIYPRQSPVLPVHESTEFHKTVANILLKGNSLSRLEYVDGNHSVHCNEPENVASVINNFLEDSKNFEFEFAKSKI